MMNNQKIPEGWSVISLKNCVKIFGRIGYRGYTCEDIVKQGEGAITLSPSNIIDNKINYEDNTYISWYKYEESPEIKIKNGDIIFVKTGSSFGKSAIIRHLPEPATINPQLIIFKDFKGNKVYFAYLISSFNFQKKVHQTVVGGTIPTLSQEEIYKYTILLPPLPEQEKIAGILGTWDEAIEKLSSLIEQKKNLKKGLMQRLLTGKTRLNGFTQPWKEVKLGEILFSLSKRNKDLTIKRVLSVTNSRGFVLPEEQFARSVASEDLSNYKIVKKGEFAYNPSRLNVGSIDRLDNFENGVLSPMYVIFKCGDKINSDYMKHWIDTAEFNTKVRNSAQGSVRETVDFKTLSTIKICLPFDINEQKAIADVLSTADEEIDLLNKKLKALKEQKKGLMQQLLTGQTRVKVN